MNSQKSYDTHFGNLIVHKELERGLPQSITLESSKRVLYLPKIEKHHMIDTSFFKEFPTYIFNGAQFLQLMYGRLPDKTITAPLENDYRSIAKTLERFLDPMIEELIENPHPAFEINKLKGLSLLMQGRLVQYHLLEVAKYSSD